MFDDDGVTLAGGDFFQRFVDHQACSEDAETSEGD